MPFSCSSLNRGKMKTSQKGLLHLSTAELCSGCVVVNNCPDPAMLKSMPVWFQRRKNSRWAIPCFSMSFRLSKHWVRWSVGKKSPNHSAGFTPGSDSAERSEHQNRKRMKKMYLGHLLASTSISTCTALQTYCTRSCASGCIICVNGCNVFIQTQPGRWCEFWCS